uniref:PDZ domain-containing protein n=1 Tax=Hanusia phi TaxID=3032 RepID=A0A7S0E3I9_9CRYP|mmetsp:Transcript_16063/g.36717  ORF Transcript_16063/g.36717 Transcript_16063/m.36717 type:complete len:154 (+) Transcript_16063:38-499(+)
MSGFSSWFKPLNCVEVCAVPSGDQQFGVGINFRSTSDGRLLVASFSPESEGQCSAKLKYGDELYKIDRTQVRGVPLSRLQVLMKGPKDSVIPLTFARSVSKGQGELSSEIIEVNLIRTTRLTAGGKGSSSNAATGTVRAADKDGSEKARPPVV